jgi:hypothetical protein
MQEIRAAQALACEKLVNHLSTLTINVNIPSAAESQFEQRGYENEKDPNQSRLLELAHGLWHERPWNWRLTIPAVHNRIVNSKT